MGVAEFTEPRAGVCVQSLDTPRLELSTQGGVFAQKEVWITDNGCMSDDKRKQKRTFWQVGKNTENNRFWRVCRLF